MRPLQLTLKGFQSYGDAHTFDFRDRTLLGIVGPIGSGKSSLLDAIAFALYGKTPRAGASTRDLINQRVDSAHVELWFDVDGSTWHAVRALRRKGQSAHNLYRRDGVGDTSKLEEISGERAVTAKVNELLGLEFDAFNRSVFLAQNRFAEFLHSRPGDRDRVLKGVFGFDRIEQMSTLAKERRDELKGQLVELERLRQEIQADKESLASEKPNLAAATKHLAALDQSANRVADLEKVLTETEAELQAAVARLDAMNDLAAEMPRREEAETLIAAAAEAEHALTSASKQVAARQVEVDQAEADQAALVERYGTVDQLAAARELLAAKQAALRRGREIDDEHLTAANENAALEDAVKDAKARLDEAKALANEAEARLKAAEKDAEKAEEAAIAARHAAAASTLRGELHVGEDCPVCKQLVSEVPPVTPSTELKSAEASLADARQKLGRIREEARTAAASLAEATAAFKASRGALDNGIKRLAHLAERKSAAEAALEGVTERISAVIAGAEPEKAIEDWSSEHERIRSAAETAARAYRQAVEAESERQALVKRLEADVSNLGTTLATLAGRLGISLDTDTSLHGLRSKLATLHDQRNERVEQDEDRQKKLSSSRDETRGQLAEVMQGLGVAEGATFSEARRRAAEETARLEGRVSALEERVARFEELKSRSRETTEELSVYEQLAADLLPSGFLKFILDQERRGLADLGSEHLEHMTSRYRFTEDGEFNVVDLNAAEAERKVESLSGGETFLASLALALALAEMVTRDGGRLDSFFLDEGFGSLDPEHVALAMEGIERLVAGDRLVAVVSHLPELRDRVEDLIILDKQPLTGDTLVIQG